MWPLAAACDELIGPGRWTRPEDAPTRLVLGSHLYVPQILAAAPEEGMGGGAVTARLQPSALCRRAADATGQAGDVCLCHPFIVHTASWPHRGT